jgi:hypothetical protein
VVVVVRPTATVINLGGTATRTTSTTMVTPRRPVLLVCLLHLFLPLLFLLPLTTAHNLPANDVHGKGLRLIVPTPSAVHRNVSHGPGNAGSQAVVPVKGAAPPSASRPGAVRHSPPPCPPKTVDDYHLLMLPKADDLEIALGYLFTFSSAALYLPQAFAISERRSTFGLSISTLFLAAMSAFSGFINILVLDWYA